MFYEGTFGRPFIALVTTCLVLGCTPEDSSVKAPSLDTSYGYVSLQLTDAPTDAESVWVTFDSLSLRSCSTSGWFSIALQSSTFDLLALQNGALGDLALEAQVPAGTYCEIRLVLRSAQIEFTDNRIEPLEVPSGGSSGLKIKGKIDVVPGFTNHVVLDFDADKSIHMTGKGNYKLVPVIKILDSKLVVRGGGEALPKGNLEEFGVFTVEPTSEKTVQLGNGSSIYFPVGSVSDTSAFTFTRWKPKLPDARSDFFRFSPTYQFNIAPVLSFPFSQNTAVPIALFVDYDVQSTTVLPNGLAATGPVPHFSDPRACSNFSDVSKASAYYLPISELVCMGAVRGYEDGTFQPDASMTRAEFLKLVVQLAYGDDNLRWAYGAYLPTEKPFPDVELSHWALLYIDWSRKRQLISGDDMGNFRPDEPINRAEAAKIFVEGARVFNECNACSVSCASLGQAAFCQIHKGDNVTAFDSSGHGNAGIAFRDYQALDYKAAYYSTSNATDEYNDVSDPSAWYYKYVYALRDFYRTYSFNVIGNNFLPQSPLKRRVAAEWAYYAANKYQLLRRSLFCQDPTDPACGGSVAHFRLSQSYLASAPINPAGYHSGMDFVEGSGKAGHNVYSPITGVLTSLGDQCGSVVIATNKGTPSEARHFFLHMTDKIGNEHINQTIPAGTLIGKIGNVHVDDKCPSTSTHLHYEIVKGAAIYACSDSKCVSELSVNPLNWEYPPAVYWTP